MYIILYYIILYYIILYYIILYYIILYYIILHMYTVEIWSHKHHKNIYDETNKFAIIPRLNINTLNSIITVVTKTAVLHTAAVPKLFFVTEHFLTQYISTEHIQYVTWSLVYQIKVSAMKSVSNQKKCCYKNSYMNFTLHYDQIC